MDDLSHLSDLLEGALSELSEDAFPEADEITLPHDEEMVLARRHITLTAAWGRVEATSYRMQIQH